ncbi:hypothetical protein PIB30_085061 [Stylosanthes scabra]|uniref:Uncharacterized protein n=1 Tax=Stylosanthes scabra TaxID=79078 RepID=A0ABU6UTI4_9FABA|nr:hypothetical protein [Stylosanthes scabra]
MASPLCTWLVAACMSVTCDADRAATPNSSKRSRRTNALSKFAPKASQFNTRLISSLYGSSIQGLISSFEPCHDYYNSSNTFSSLFRSKTPNSNFNRRHRRHSGKLVKSLQVNIFLLLFAIPLSTPYWLLVFGEVDGAPVSLN